MKYRSYTLCSGDTHCLPSWFSYPLLSDSIREDWWKSRRTNGQTDGGRRMKRDKGQSKRERVTNPTRGTEVLIPRSTRPLLFQAKTQAGAHICHAHASYLIGKCANIVPPFRLFLPTFYHFFLFLFFYLVFRCALFYFDSFSTCRPASISK